MKSKPASSLPKSKEQQRSPMVPQVRGSRSLPGGTLDFREAVGKVIDRIRYISEPSESESFEVRFTDGTFLFLEPLPRVYFRARYLKIADGEMKSVHDYGILPKRHPR